MELNREEALRAKINAEKLFSEKDFTGARNYALKAQMLFPELEGISQMVATFEVYIASEVKVNGETDFYSILGLAPSAGTANLKKQYNKMAVLLHPDKNKTVGADGAFKLVSDAWTLLSNSYKRKRNGQVPSGVVQTNSPSVSNGLDTFWTVCTSCQIHYEYLQKYLNKRLSCKNCRCIFIAVETGTAPMNGSFPYSGHGSEYVSNVSFPLNSFPGASAGVVDPHMLPDEPSIMDLGGDPNTVSTDPSLSSEESGSVIIYTPNRDPSPSRAAYSEAREPPPTMGSRESTGQTEAAAGPISMAAAQILREEEDDGVGGLLSHSASAPGTSHQRTPPSAAPSGSQQQSTSAILHSSTSFLDRVAVGSPGVSNGSFLQGRGSSSEEASTVRKTSPRSPACSTSQIASPRPSARRAPTPPPQLLPLGINRQLEVNQEFIGGPTSSTDSDLNSLFKDMSFIQSVDVLGGQGSAALGDFGAELDSGMGEQNRDEVESRERSPPRQSPATNLGKGLMATGMEAPVRLFPADFPVDEAYHPLLNTIARAHPETFAHFNPRSAQLGGLLLRNLHEVLTPWAQLRFGDFSAETETALQEVAQDMAAMGFDLGWLSARSSALRAAGERLALRPELQSLSAQLASARQHLAELETRFDHLSRYDAGLAAEALNLEDPDPEELVFADWLG